MKYLLDTHVLIWAISDPDNLSEKVISVIEDSNNRIFVSSVSLWEIALKVSLGKLNIEGLSPEELPIIIKEQSFETLPLNEVEASTYHNLLEKWHKDPFDRMLIWQAINNGLILITKDKYIPKYTESGLKVFW